MAYAQVNDMWLPLAAANSTVGLMEVDASASSKVSLTVTTQVGIGTDDVRATISGSNDRASWFDLGATYQQIAPTGARTVSGEVKGYAWVRGVFTRFGGSGAVLISASINTGL